MSEGEAGNSGARRWTKGSSRALVEGGVSDPGVGVAGVAIRGLLERLRGDGGS